MTVIAIVISILIVGCSIGVIVTTKKMVDQSIESHRLMLERFSRGESITAPKTKIIKSKPKPEVYIPSRDLNKKMKGEGGSLFE